jgi:hypothetical protein
VSHDSRDHVEAVVTTASDPERPRDGLEPMLPWRPEGIEMAGLPKGVLEKRANVNGVRINYKMGGRGPAVVLLHGYAQTSHMWLPLIRCSRPLTP